MAPNRLHIMLASNETVGGPRRHWKAAASSCSTSSDAHANDHAYFAAIQDELEHGGYEAMLHELLNRDITEQPAQSPGHRRPDRPSAS